MKIINYCNKIIEYSFYAIFLFVPLFFTNSNSELFELSKMWITWGFAIVIATAWFSKMLVQKRVNVKRTPLDIPIALFILSQLISTIFSLDSRVSLWGYYSRFNGGFLSLFTYIFLYYAFVSNLSYREVIKSLTVSLFAGLIVALWGLPSHFGKDPTCLLFRGALNVDCWTEAFRPTIRIFSTLGQPAWLAAYLALLIPVAVAFALRRSQAFTDTQKHARKTGILGENMWFYYFFALAVLFYLDLTFANTRAGILAFWAGNAFFWLGIFFSNFFSTKLFVRYLLLFNIAFLLCNFIWGSPIAQLRPFTLPELLSRAATPAYAQEQNTPQAPQAQAPAAIDSGITDSGKIRLYVWRGAIDAWKAHPLFGTGVETYAYAYYKHRPAEHNLTSEWDYLYNKAHNEYLNYLATTGAFGLGSYVLFIVWFLATSRIGVAKHFRKNHAEQAPSHPTKQDSLLILSLVSGFLTILISNFFGFSVVIINVYLFLIPAFVLFLKVDIETADSLAKQKNHFVPVSGMQWAGITFLVLFSFYLHFLLFTFWRADRAYALGYNLNRIGEYQQAYPNLKKAVDMRPAEPVFKDEYAYNLTALTAGLFQANQATTAATFAQQAIALSDEVVTGHPNNVVFWKNRVRVFYTLSQLDNKFLPIAIQAIAKANELAPTDAKIAYNYGVLLGQAGKVEDGVKILEKTVQMKPDYQDAYYALGLFYRQKATGDGSTVIDPIMQEKAIATMKYILEKLNPKNETVKQELKNWNAL